MAYYEGEIAPIGGGYNNNDNGMFSGGWGGLIGLIAVAALFGWGNGGFGFGGGNNSAYGVDAAVQRGFDTQSIISKLDGISNGICDSTFALNNTMTNGFAGVQQSLCQGFNGIDRSVANLGFQLQSCCCDLSRQIDGVNYNMAKNTCDITNAINGSTQQILGFLTQEKISALQAENAALTSQLSQNAQTQTLINTLRPCPTPAYITCSPFESVYGFGNYGRQGNCGCGNGCGCGC